MRALISLALLIAVSAFPEERWTTPVLGAVFDAAGKTLRPVIGVAGAANLGEAVAVPVKIERAFVAPDEASAVVTGAEGTAVVSWIAGEVNFVPLVESIAPAGVSWSGRKFALYDAQGNVQVWLDGKLLESRTSELAGTISLCDDGRIAAGVCGPDGDYSLDASGVIRMREGKRDLVTEGTFGSIAEYKGIVAAAGEDLLLIAQGDKRRFALRANAVSLQALRSPGVFVVGLDDGSTWIYGEGELQLLDGGRQ